MSVAKSLLGYREFWAEDRIRKLITKSKKFDGSQESPDDARSLLIFRTSKQQSWLVATPERLYFILDDARKPGPHISRSDSRKSLLNQGSLADIVKARPHTERTGVIEIGQGRRGWYYSRLLFTDRPIEDEVVELLQRA